MKYGYHPETYAGLLSVSESAAIFQEKQAEKALLACGKVFLKHSLQQSHGLVLLHRHHELTNDQFMVEYRGTATPWPIEARLPEGAKIEPTTWALADGSMKPYEFEFVRSAGTWVTAEGSSFVVVLVNTHEFMKEQFVIIPVL